MRIEGLVELNEKLHRLREEVGNKDAGKVLYSSLIFASTPMYQQARANAPFRTGVIKGAIKRRRLTRGDSANIDGAAIAVYVEIKGSRKSRENAYYYIFHEEYGARGRPPIPFIRPAFDNNQTGATDRFAQKLGEKIDKIMG